MEAPKIRVIASGTVSWPPVEEMRQKLTENGYDVKSKNHKEILELYQALCEQSG